MIMEFVGGGTAAGHLVERALRLSRGPVRALPSASLTALLREQVERAPEGIALRHGAELLCYDALEARANALAARLLARGVGTGHTVALCSERGIGMVIAMLAVLRSGAAYVPIDPDAPPARARASLRASEPSLVLASHSTRALLSFAQVPLLIIEEPEHVSAPPPCSVGELAYVIFTSGSTGQPKGVAVRQRALINHALSMAELYGLTSRDRVLCSASIAFDVAAEQIYPALLCGAQVVVRPDDLFEALSRFDAFVRAVELTTLILPAAFFHEWARALGAGELTLPPSLRAVGVGTEQVRARELSAFLRAAGDRVRVLQGYGPTEATITCTAYLHDGRALADDAVVPIGVPLPNTEAYVLDAHGALAGDGELGELYVGGVALARGYVGAPELTRERFVPHPFAGQPGERLYRTGDLVRRGADGQLSFVGRRDHQLKLRGHRVEPGEIEQVLCEQQGITQALVVVREDARKVARLVAYVISSQPQDAAALALACRERLPAHMVPSAFVMLDSFPLTLNQKVDRDALPVPAELSREHVAARNDAELLLTRAFRESLELPAVGVHDDFFALGGDSLRALRLLQIIRRDTSCELALAEVFGAPTPAALASRVEHGGGLDVPSVLCLKQGQGAPLFVVCGIQIYQALADALTAPNPVYALFLPREAVFADGRSALPTVERFAADYVQALRAHTPRGPYLLGGLSFGGAVAYEMAQQLMRAGESVPLVALFDTVLPRARSWLSRERLRHQLGALPRPALVEHARARLRRLRTSSAAPKDAPLQELDRQRARAYGASFSAYDRTIQPYPGRLVLYRALASEEGACAPHYGFARLARRLQVHAVPGDHLGLLRAPNVHELARHLALELRAAQGRAASG